MKQSEARVSTKIIRACRERGAFVFKVHGSEYQMAGLPDILCCYKGVYIGFETKMPAERDNVSPKQAHVHAMIVAAGGLVSVVCGVDEAMKVLDAVDRRTARIDRALNRITSKSL